jgi:hypothetical protein
VIDDAFAWKGELLKVADRLEAKTALRRWTDRTGHLIERDFIVAAYAMRKLIEANEVSDELRRRDIPVRRFDLRGRPPTELHPSDLSEFYDLEIGRRTTLSVQNLCHEILHSFTFTFYCGETADLFDGVYVSSDRRAFKHVYLLLASDFIALCADLGDDEFEATGI